MTEAVVLKVDRNKNNGFLKISGRNRNIYFTIDGQELLPGEEPQLPEEMSTVEVLELRGKKRPRAVRWRRQDA